MDAVDPDTGLIEMGDFMRVCSIYCFFGKPEILRTIYNFADSKKAGEITHEQFVNVLNILNPFDKIR
jgi:Ca2+-binding EF-hand superfamily protein